MHAYDADLFVLAEMLSRLGHVSVGACLDIGHAHLSAGIVGMHLESGVEALLPHVRHLHVHDNNALSETLSTGSAEDDLAFGIGDCHAPLGTGTIDFQRIRCLLVKASPCVVIHELSQRFEDNLTDASSLFEAWYCGLEKGWAQAAKM